MTQPIPHPSNPNFSLHPCTPSDLPQMVSVYTSAFETDAFRLSRFPSSQVPRSVFDPWLTGVFRKYLGAPHTQCVKIVENSTGNMAGWTHWAEPHTLSAEEKEAKRVEDEREERERREKGEGKFPAGSTLHICEAKHAGWDRFREKWYRSEDMYCRLLLTSITALADTHSKSCYLEASAAGYPLYAKCGFREVDVLEVELGGDYGVGRNWAMVREPRGLLDV
ncbi:hypothetical protein NHQ30_006750 [Ciborinia camelliae]|nr:hypothetical protein NHQ30_006750 [Ciborinia camelliae]